jgi:hypothetical protein
MPSDGATRSALTRGAWRDSHLRALRETELGDRLLDGSGLRVERRGRLGQLLLVPVARDARERTGVDLDVE